MSDSDAYRFVFVDEVIRILAHSVLCRFGTNEEFIPTQYIGDVYVDNTYIPEGVEDEYLEGETNVFMEIVEWIILDRGIESFIVDEPA